MAPEVDDDYYVEEEDYDDDEYGYLSDNFPTDDEDDDMESLIHFDLLKVPFEACKDLPPEERLRWTIAHFIVQKNASLFDPRRGQESKVEEQVSKVEEQVSKVADGGDVEESKVPKMNDDDGGPGPRGSSWKRSSKPSGV